jgi:cyclic pyranopterin phosphate synthase
MTAALVDRYGRRVDYVRLSVTDRCDFRCVYCMAEDMTFVPRAQVLTLEELLTVGKAFVSLGVRKIRLTGGEPLVRNNILWLVQQLAALPGLEQLVMTTNGSRLASMAAPLKAAGLSRLNISLDSLNAGRFRELTRTGNLADVLAGIDAARAAGFRNIKLNSVILRGRNDDEIIALVRFARESGLDITFIEEMPLGFIDEHDRALAFMPSDAVREVVNAVWPLSEIPAGAGAVGDGPSRYWRMAGSTTRVGFISPHSHNFCHLCNRVRVTVEGRLLLCLGNEHAVDLRQVLRSVAAEDALAPFAAGAEAALCAAIVAAMDLKPEKHHFDLSEAPQIVRFMNMTGG